MKTIMITGACSGIGRACAELFLGAGWQVGLMARRADLLEEMAAAHEAALALPADVTDPAAVARAFDALQAKTGRIDVLFNNAGTFGRQVEIDELSFEDWTNVVDVNLHGMFLCAQAAYARMKQQDPQGGRIINNGSISADRPRERSIGYTTTKHAITGMTKTLSLDGRTYDIACGQIDIGNARTDMVDELNARRVTEGLEPVPTMDVGEAADAVLHMANLPLSANVLFMTIMATKMPFIGRG